MGAAIKAIIKSKSLFPKKSSVFQFFRQLGEKPSAAFGLFLIVSWVIIAASAPLLVPYEPTAINYPEKLEPPNINHLFGTDKFGRDVFSRVLMGSRSILILAPAATGLGLVLGTVVGLMSGYFGGYLDEVIMRTMDAFLSLPVLLLALVVLGVLGQSLINVIIVIGLVYMPRFARVIRSAVLEVKPKEFVKAARVRGESSLYIMCIEILPNITGPMVVTGSIRFAYSIFTAASLNFLGLGIPPPSPDWGLMVSEGRDYIMSAPWIAVFPALAISSLVVGVNLFTDWLRKEKLAEVQY